MSYRNRFQAPRGTDPQLAEALKREFRDIEQVSAESATSSKVRFITQAVSAAGTVTVQISPPFDDSSYGVEAKMYMSDGSVVQEIFKPETRTKSSFKVLCAATGTLFCVCVHS